ncbi:elongation factor G [Sneathia sanguinegens]|uniref:elongation factor G n=1 Tax=Sneathia sanguinegens TaxID=40543 RepID=UPI00288BDDBC|nr:elongation factor G [Sneathia sanguinegens]
MKSYSTEKIRNLALVGHSSSGKTSVCEALLFKSGVTNRLGKVDDGNTVTDFEKEEISRKVSISTATAVTSWKDFKINLIDTPGYFDFSGEVYSALRASEAALVVLDAQNSIEVGAEKVLKYTESIELPRIIFVNKMDKENVNFAKVVSDLHIKFGKKVIPFTLALGEGENFKGIIDVLNKKAYEYKGFERVEVPIPEIRIEEVNHVYDTIVEVVAETDDELMEKFFNEEEFSHEEFLKGVTSALLNGSAVPLICGSATTGAGIDMLLDVITDYMPAPDDKRAKRGFRNEDENVRKISKDEPFSAVVFKTIVDPFIGRISIFKVISGKIDKDTVVYNSTKGQEEKVGSLFYLNGKTQIETKEIIAGDIGAISKLTITQTGDTLCDKNNKTLYKKIKYPKANLYFAIEPKSKNDEDKISIALHKLQEEDPSFVSIRNKETKQLLIGGQGNVQLQVILDKLKNSYAVQTNVVPLKIAYRETIKGKSDVQGKHKKQSGGAGQYGDVFVRFEPSEKEFEFAEEVFGGSVPKNYFPAVEKGIKESTEKGILAGYPVVNIKATLYDGSYQHVDSNEMAFKIAASLAFKKGMEKANPILLEPIMKIEVIIPEEYMGDVMGDLNKRRGKVLGVEILEDGNQKVVGEAPHSELFEYAIDLRSMTQARGEFVMEFDRYEEIPSAIAQKIIEDAKEK